MRKIILIVLLIISVLIISGCITYSEKEPTPDPIIGNWHRQSYSGIPILTDLIQNQWAPNEITFNSDGTCSDGSWKWVSNNSFEIYSKNSFVPNGTISLDNDKMYLSRWGLVSPGIINATYAK